MIIKIGIGIIKTNVNFHERKNIARVDIMNINVDLNKNEKLVVNASLIRVQSEDKREFKSPVLFSSKNWMDLLIVLAKSWSRISYTTDSEIISI